MIWEEKQAYWRIIIFRYPHGENIVGYRQIRY